MTYNFHQIRQGRGMTDVPSFLVLWKNRKHSWTRLSIQPSPKVWPQTGSVWKPNEGSILLKFSRSQSDHCLNGWMTGWETYLCYLGFRRKKRKETRFKKGRKSVACVFWSGFVALGQQSTLIHIDCENLKLWYAAESLLQSTNGLEVPYVSVFTNIK